VSTSVTIRHAAGYRRPGGRQRRHQPESSGGR
jgi:hypothetical protein